MGGGPNGRSWIPQGVAPTYDRLGRTPFCSFCFLLTKTPPPPLHTPIHLSSPRRDVDNSQPSRYPSESSHPSSYASMWSRGRVDAPPAVGGYPRSDNPKIDNEEGPNTARHAVRQVNSIMPRQAYQGRGDDVERDDKPPLYEDEVGSSRNDTRYISL